VRLPAGSHKSDEQDKIACRPSGDEDEPAGTPPAFGLMAILYNSLTGKEPDFDQPAAKAGPVQQRSAAELDLFHPQSNHIGSKRVSDFMEHCPDKESHKKGANDDQHDQ
jgi:hypothetical protein